MASKLRLYCLIVFCLLPALTQAAPKAKLQPFWLASKPDSNTQVNHKPWQDLLNRYLNKQHASGINRFDYQSVNAQDKKQLSNYLKALQDTDPRQLNPKEQQAYWINLYNAATVNLVLEHPNIDSIKQIKSSWISFGPWDKKIVTIANQAISLNDIEHGILRPIWKDHRFHYLLNCASLGCPNLRKTAITAENLNTELAQAEKEFITHPRAVLIQGKSLLLSSIYQWYGNDFADNDAQLIEYLKQHLPASMASEIKQTNTLDYHYDWNLNRP